MRIVGGRHRGRRIEAPAGRDVRPTSDRTREALFNVLAHAAWGADDASSAGAAIEDAIVLDAFCGTGALALEAISRGALRAVLMDVSTPSLDAARRNAAALGEQARCRILRADATRPPPAPEPCTLAFLDPPYGKGLAEAALPALLARGWLAPGALVVVETAARDPLALPSGLAALDERGYGETRISFLRVVAG
ncbi:RsmD family RNA methyltransferase [Arenibaculum pallidiluteum]|uniref:RsmD family RNA methyltransferase n=1 Tax=Arenibaculum pallidiluteum TaxID=2812559 RepID=UPI001A97778B|nr:RsmD family RNA methyltransferase [Arenibaculum pallidiluteum]